VIFGISEAFQTNADWTFLKHSLGRYIFDLAIPLDSSVPLPPTIWLTEVKHESLSFFQRNKDPRAYIDISNYSLLIGFFYKYLVLLFSTVCVENETIVANIISSKSYTRNLLLALRFSNFHFYVQNCRFRALFCRFTAN
jgi:hypothetical protein